VAHEILLEAIGSGNIQNNFNLPFNMEMTRILQPFMKH